MMEDNQPKEHMPNIETTKTPIHAWLLDVDGVLTHPERKINTEPDIINQIAQRLQRGEPVAIVTGRSIEFINKNVMEPLKKAVSETKHLQNVLTIGEKGGVWVSYDQNGEETETTDESITIPENLQEGVRNLVASQFKETMFFDETKRTMISVEMNDGVNLADFHKIQTELNQKLEELISTLGLTESFTFDSTTIATDIQSNHVGKGFAAKRVLEWLNEKGINPETFIAVGDSPSDAEMATEIHSQGHNVEFVFVRERDKFGIKGLPFPVEFTSESFEKGTLELFILKKPLLRKT